MRGHIKAFHISSLHVETPAYWNKCKNKFLRMNLGASLSKKFLAPEL